MVKIALITILALCITNSLAQVPPFDEDCVTDAYPPKENTLVPTYVLNLDLPPQQRWNEIVTAFKPQVYV